MISEATQVETPENPEEEPQVSALQSYVNTAIASANTGDNMTYIEEAISSLNNSEKQVDKDNAAILAKLFGITL